MLRAPAPGPTYTLARAIYRLTQRAVQEATLAVSTGPLSPLSEMQSVALRVGLGQLIREAIATGRWYERQAREVANSNAELGWDDESTTEPRWPRH